MDGGNWLWVAAHIAAPLSRMCALQRTNSRTGADAIAKGGAPISEYKRWTQSEAKEQPGIQETEPNSARGAQKHFAAP